MRAKKREGGGTADAADFVFSPSLAFPAWNALVTTACQYPKRCSSAVFSQPCELIPTVFFANLALVIKSTFLRYGGTPRAVAPMLPWLGIRTKSMV